MKSNFIKTALPAFALVLAITASLAFTSSKNNSNLIEYWYQFGGDEYCAPIPVSEDTCTTDYTGKVCTILGVKETLYALDSNNRCNLFLYNKLN